MVPNGSFPGCNPPNPERIESYTLALEKAKEIKADIILATDPDTDRVGACILHNNEYRLLTGNQIGALLCRYFLENKNFEGKTPYVVKSLVSTDLVEPICKKYGAKLFNVPTGFKYIGEKIGSFEKDENMVFALGSLGNYRIGFCFEAGILGIHTYHKAVKGHSGVGPDGNSIDRFFRKLTAAIGKRA